MVPNRSQASRLSRSDWQYRLGKRYGIADDSSDATGRGFDLARRIHVDVALHARRVANLQRLVASGFQLEEAVSGGFERELADRHARRHREFLRQHGLRRAPLCLDVEDQRGRKPSGVFELARNVEQHGAPGSRWCKPRALGRGENSAESVRHVDETVAAAHVLFDQLEQRRGGGPGLAGADRPPVPLDDRRHLHRAAEQHHFARRAAPRPPGCRTPRRR